MEVDRQQLSPSRIKCFVRIRREGGLPIFSDGKCVGANGVSGGKSSEDAQVAKAGVDALK